VLLAAILRVYQIGTESLWLDEVLSISLATDQPVIGIVTRPLQADPHPPLYYVILHYWTQYLGLSESALRLPSVIFGVIAVIAMYGVGRQLFGHRGAILAAVLLSLSASQIRYSQEARAYSFMVMLSIVSFYFLLKIRKDYTQPRAVGYVLSTALLGYSHVFGAFLILAQSIYLLTSPFVTGEQPISRRTWITLQAIVAAILLPWVLRLINHFVVVSQVGSSNLSWIPPPSLKLFALTFVRYIGLNRLPVPALIIGVFALMMVGVLAAATALRAYVNRADDSRLDDFYLSVVWLLTPIIVPLMISYLFTPVYFPRFALAASPGLFLLLVIGLRSIDSNSIQYTSIILVFLVFTAPLYPYYTADQKEQWDEATSYVESNADVDDLVLIADDYVNVTYNYYSTRDELTTMPVDGGITPAELRRTTSSYKDVWFVISHASSRNETNALSTLRSKYKQVEHREYEGIDLYYFRLRDDQTVEGRNHFRSAERRT